MWSQLQALEKRKQELFTSLAAAKKARDEADGKMQSRYDTQKEEWALQCDILESQIYEIDKLMERLKKLEKPPSAAVVSVGHRVELEFEDGERAMFLLLDSQGGVDLDSVQTLSIDSPIGRAILGARPGDRVTAKMKTGGVQVQIVSVE
jgi:transcription elongation factor GreA